MIYAIVSGVPLLLSSFGALISDAAGRLAIFMDGIINLAAFLCFALTVKCGSAAAGCALSVVLCVLLTGVFIAITEAVKADYFLMGLSLNIISNALVSFLSSAMFGKRGVLTDAALSIPAPLARNFTTIAALVLLLAGAVIFMTSRPALYLRMCGTGKDVLQDRGVQTACYTAAASLLAAVFAALAGCTFTLRLSAFVPGVSSGTGWLALAAVYIARSISQPFKKGGNGGTGWAECGFVFALSIALSAAGVFASRAQNIWKDAASALLLSMQYLAALLLLALLRGGRAKDY